MAKKNIIDLVLKTINDVQKNNQKDPNVKTADSNVFDLLKDKLKNLDDKNRKKRAAKGKSPDSILDLIRKEIEGVRTQNKRDPSVRTAPKSVFKDILNKVNQKPAQQAAKGISSVISEYNLNVNKIPQKVLLKIQDKYQKDIANINKQYAQAMHDLSKKY